MKNIFSIICLITFASTLLAQGKQADEGLIRITLNNYIEGRNNGDTARLASAFHKSADLRFRNEENGNLVIWSISDYVGKFTPGKKINCTGKIVSIDIAGSAA
ncbi:Putative lumazine-binding [Chitinophaga ginsengisegetis]|uniref:Putative lumazine-binding n=2 Tax=Chitinophaga ginsengisegetis TaxID=393003 RepID=A0A1T5NYC5_9BACT|nr:nuclear transport factor 2 family protein [Chitinophaga ginsengisegetis]SKD05376.1 Putative lumazine-binding [Chitinophaga ginsengisegetis]